jgi:hypothetical protein
MSLTCKACQEALIGPAHTFHAGCHGCDARAVSRGKNYKDSQQQGSLTREYIDELARFNLTHAEVRQAAERDALNAQRAQAARAI